MPIVGRDNCCLVPVVGSCQFWPGIRGSGQLCVESICSLESRCYIYDKPDCGQVPELACNADQRDHENIVKCYFTSQ